MDWNSGIGQQYYNTSLKHKELIKRLIMCGKHYGANDYAADFSLGRIYGIDIDANKSGIKVGLSDMGRQPIHW